MLNRSLPLRTRLAPLALAALVAPGIALAQDPGEADIAALRYFIDSGDTASAAAEIERLSEVFPGADIPAVAERLGSPVETVDTTEIWQFIEADDYSAAHAAIAEAQRANTTWQPDAHMLDILDSREQQAAFETAVAVSDLPGAMSAVNAYPDLLTCNRINNAWRLALLQEAAGEPDQAILTHTGILSACREPDFVIATLQKASAIASDDELVRLIDYARARNPELDTGLDVLQAELIEDGDEEADADTAVAAGTATPRRAVPAAAPAAPAPSRQVSARRPAAPAQPSGRIAAAIAAADRGDFAECLRLTASPRTAAEYNQRGWCALNSERPLEAAASFQTAARQAGDADLRRDANFGAVTALSQAGEAQRAANLSRQSNLTREQRRLTDRTILASMANDAFNAGRYMDALRMVDQLSQQVGTLDRGTAMLRGWSLYKLGRKSAAERAFRAVHRSSPGQDTFKAIQVTRRD